MDTKIPGAIDELRGALPEVQLESEGFDKFARIGLSATTAADVAQSRAIWDQRIAKMAAAALALQTLVDDGYPSLPVRTVSPTTVDELRADLAALNAAVNEFNPAAAAESITLTASTASAR